MDEGRDQDELRSEKGERGVNELDAGKDQDELRSKKGGGGMSWMKGRIRMS